MAVKSRALRSGRTQLKRTPAKRARRKKSASPGMIETVLATFAHEVRTPLTGILAVSELLATSDLDERERRWVDTIKAGAEHLSGLATLFVDAARLGTTGLGLRSEFFDLRALARHAGDSLSGRAAAKGLRATVTISPRLPGFAIGDSVRLRAALENLIDNAVKFTERGDVALKVTAAAAGPGKSQVSFAVSDSGIGLSLTEIKRLFRPFSQANVSIASRFGGAGLGLSSVRQIARALGGDVTVAQRPRGGTVFTLTVTLERAKPPQLSTPGGAVRASGGGRLRILSVEDNPFGRVVLNAILSELGHQCDFVGSGEAVPERLAKGEFDAVLMDMVLPGISGIEAIERIRTLPPPLGAIPIIGVSGRDQDEAAARQAGADGFLLKPVSPRALATALLAASSPRAAAT
jgi:CheY-like chemotaxis protein/nitrogen-specific signal transduction histidine kinase